MTAKNNGTAPEAQVKERMSWDSYEKAVGELVKKIQNSGKKYDVIYGIPRGGLVLAVTLSHRLNVPITLELNEEHEDAKVLIVDDVVDTGRTAIEMNAKRFDTATLYYKPWRSYNPTYSVIETSHWIIFPWEKGDAK